MSDDIDGSSETKIIFKKRKRPAASFRVNELDENRSDAKETKGDEAENETTTEIDWQTLDELRTLQKAKKRQTKGIDVLDLLKDNNGGASGKNGDKSKEKSGSGGGLTDSRSLARELDLGNTFSLETNRRDEDAELMRYVEEELAKRRAANSAPDDSAGTGNSENPDQTRDLLMKSMPEHLLKLINENKSKNEEMLSSQMLSGIPEVDLGIEERIRNIEKTEAARAKLFEKRLQREFGKSDHGEDQLLKDISFAPKNLSAYANRNQLATMISNNHPMQNHRFNLNSVTTENKDLIVHFIEKEEKKSSGKFSNHQQQQPVQQYDIEPVVVIGDEPQKVRLPRPIDKDKRMPAKDKPMDNFVFEKFRKHLKKH